MINTGTGRLSQVLRHVDDKDIRQSTPSPRRQMGGDWVLKVAADRTTREKAYRLVYEQYLEKGYAQPRASGAWITLHDALPETTTLLVETADGVAVGALTVVFDSPMGLPADQLYKTELDALRASGRRLSEIISLGVATEAGSGSEVLVKLFNAVYLLSKKVRGASDFVITVNPRHVRFYERTLLFQAAGPERSYEKVGGAPALLLRLDLDVPEEMIRLEHGPAEGRPPKSRTLYPMFHPPEEEPDIVAALATALKPMGERDLGYFCVGLSSVLENARPAERKYLQSKYPQCDFAQMFLTTTVRF